MQIQEQPTDKTDSLDILINMGPQHPSTHGVFRLVIWVDGERIVRTEPHIGYLHRGAEKLFEDEQYSQVITLFDRLDYISNFNSELAFCVAVEKLMEIEVPERAQYIRVILCELNRIANHMLFYGVFGLDAGAMTPVLYGFRERENIQALFETVTGARMMHNYFRVGGVNTDLPDDFGTRLTALASQLERAIEECDELLSQNEMFLARTKGIGILEADEAIALGVTGPALRASGVLEDVRISEPYSIYDRFDFGIPVGTIGDCWDRYYVRVEEMRQSLRIIDQAAAQIEPGDIQARMRRIARPPKGEVYSRTESPRGDLAVFLVSDGSDKPYRLKVRAPSFATLQALQPMLRDAFIADAVVVLGSTDIVLGEVDR
ncbi:MAG: NADH-quinone oxidoreductase subunit D [SAR202 cluster bacterium]|jgi:NADH-quinone oxidoreductase subunit D|nr:NADH-quinone oxidoreductase subunit D [SAR202 cluster bacterium]MDP6300892.1 NADH-quinone oxidoreductase subunit D [SAR202 cluster bacterium]MDP7103720.1 NADH-quinone oxidoreductase subunit D [SAR202 cluster bacterium]MDP7226018.1 NADH-quinone oxidoreductase subunit D [SAR202 cluster bacterium]MDP7414828.1 NADH-quinone oxidoreductase subunit D [SAR202 cluster bacterium]